MEFDDEDFELRTRGDRSWTHHIRGVLQALIAFAAIAIVIGLFWPEFQRQRDLAAHNAALEERIAEQEWVHAQRTRELDWLRNDPEYVEMLARDRLDLQKENEVIFRFDIPTSISAQAR